MANKSFVLHGINTVSFEDKPIPTLGPEDVLVLIKKTGICGSDVHFLTHGHIGDFWVRSPMVLGHESAGIVHSVGSGVTSVKPGDRVALEPGVTCRRCDACKSGRYQLCNNIVFAATPPTDGTLARFYKVPQDLAYRLPEGLTLEDGAMMEPLSVAVHAAHSISRVQAGQTVAVFGCGPVGLLCMSVSRVLGASRILAVDIQPSRLEFARGYAATDTFLPPPMLAGESRVAYSRRCAEGICELMGWSGDLVKGTGEGGADTVLEATGAETCIQTGVFVAKRAGVFTQIGMGAENATIPVTTALVKELTIRGSFRYGVRASSFPLPFPCTPANGLCGQYGDYPLAISFAAQHKIDLRPLVTHRFPFERAEEAFEATKNGKDAQGKWVIKTLIDGPE
ncbi:xylitol dehydrogenase [Calocera viscosa TUFC12733]|uniref:Xylitol dehydrogenase n=1 Tax=Calocera viscosa (strain TUFC12733) TaxID=1330018 RepID=A0A167QNB2_CALVF|nr:xylitol dehydrogenase [Calocera viscosa TUFC12733]